jgi:hypothetical protein
LPAVNPVRDEDIIFYLDLTEKKFNKKDLIKALSDFIRQKQPLNPTGTYGLFVFESGKTPSFTSDLNGPKEIEDLIDKEWKAREMEESYFENGLFFCLSHIANSFIRSDARNLRVIVISDTPSNPGDTDKVQALVGLVEKFHYFPAFIDIIRIGNEKFYPDDVKLRIVTATANGGLFYVEDEKGLRDTLVQGLVKRKTLETLTPLGGTRFIEPEHHAFFANMASQLVTPPPGPNKSCSLCKGDICPFCGDPQDAPYACPGCGITYHDCCAARYSIQNHIGIKYIFRCPNCTTLLKVAPETVANLDQTTAEQNKPGESYDTGLLQQIVGDQGQPQESPENGAHPEIPVTQPAEMAPKEPPTIPPSDQSSSIPPPATGPRFTPARGPGFFRPRGPLKPPSGTQAPAAGDQKEIWKPPTETVAKTPEAASTTKPPVKPPPLDATRRSVARVLVCRICGHSLPQRAARCPNCGGIVTQN